MEIQDTPFWLFNCAYLAFLGPVIYWLARMHSGEDPRLWEAAPLPLGAAPFDSLLSAVVLLPWMGMLYLLLRWALSRLGWKLGDKSALEHKDDLVRMSYIHVAFLVVARVQWRLIGDPGNSLLACQEGPCLARPQVTFLGMVFFYMSFFSVLFEMVRHVNLHISVNVIGDPKGLWVLLFGTLILFDVLQLHLWLAFHQGLEYGCAYLGWVTLVLLGHVAVHVLTPTTLRSVDSEMWAEGTGGSEPPLKLHVHHWYWAALASHFAVFDTPLSFHAQALFLGVYLHGVAGFGLEPIFEYDHRHPAKAL